MLSAPRAGQAEDGIRDNQACLVGSEMCIRDRIYTERKLGNQPELYALSTIIFLIVLIVLFVVNRISIKKERSAVKRKNY